MTDTFEDLFAREMPKLMNCVHCGLCLEHCPTYRLTGDESNSPRGRLAIWRALAEKRIDVSAETDFYTDDCVGCLACQTVCPANVPYGDLLYEARRNRVANGKPVHGLLRLAGSAVQHRTWFNVLNAPVRALRRIGVPLHRFLFAGNPSVTQSTADYAARIMQQLRPDGPTVALFTGCLMEGVFREINFATVRVLAANNVRIVIPEAQGCCGALLEHAGLAGKDALDDANRAAFDQLDVDCVITNAAGCGLALGHALTAPTRDLTSFLNELDLRTGRPLPTDHLYYDIPCHLYHGQQIKDAPARVFEAIGSDWSLAPMADRCCGSGGTYNVTNAENAELIISEKSAFLSDAKHAHCTLVTANHVCMMQWHSAISRAGLRSRVSVQHLVQALDQAYDRAGVYGESMKA